MNINIHNKVNKCQDLQISVKRFLIKKSKNNPVTFMPFEVQTINITPKQPKTLMDFRQMYKTAYSEKKHIPNYMSPIKRSQKLMNMTKTDMFTKKYNSENKKSEINLNQAFIHTFYANQVLNEKRTRTADLKSQVFQFKKLNFTQTFMQYEELPQLTTKNQKEKLINEKIIKKRSASLGGNNYLRALLKRNSKILDDTEVEYLKNNNKFPKQVYKNHQMQG